MLLNRWFLLVFFILFQQCPANATLIDVALRLELLYSDDTLSDSLNLLDPRNHSRLQDLKQIAEDGVPQEKLPVARYTNLLIQMVQKDPSDSVKNYALKELGELPPTQSVVDLHTHILTSAVLFPVHASVYKQARSNLDQFVTATESNLNFSGAIRALDLARPHQPCSLMELIASPN